MVQKRGQVTVFLVIGVVILFLAAGMFYMVSSSQKDKMAVAEEETPLSIRIKPQLRMYVESCLKDTAVPGIFLLGMQGGVVYPENPDTILLTEEAIINYAYLNGVNQLDLGIMEEELNQYVEDSLPECLDGFAVFEKQGINVEQKSQMEASTLIADNHVKITLEYELEARVGTDVISLETFSYAAPLRVGEVVGEAESIVENLEKNPHVSPDVESDLFLSSFPFDLTTTVYSLSDERSIIDGAPFTFIFAYEDETANIPPEIGYLADFIIKKDSPFLFQLPVTDVDDNIVAYTSDSEEFTIDEEGMIFAKLMSIGQYKVTFTVEDASGLKDEQEVTFTVIE